jgi:hypothetical protein
MPLAALIEMPIRDLNSNRPVFVGLAPVPPPPALGRRTPSPFRRGYGIRHALLFLAVLLLGHSGALPARAAQAPLLRPLSDSDQMATRGSGCQLAFNIRRSTFVYAIGHDFMLRTRAGRAVCPIDDQAFSALSQGGSRSCGGVRVTIRRTGRTTDNQATDSSSGPASLTVTGGGRTWTARGYWGVAC